MGNSDKRQWTWTVESSGALHGPFSTRTAAIKDARDQLSGQILVGKIKIIHPYEFACCTVVADLLDEMEKLADMVLGTEPGYAIFDVPEDLFDKAAGELDSLVRKWAKKYVTTNSVTISDGEWIDV